MARSGEGPPVLVLGGTGSDLRNYPNALEWSIANRFDLLTYDHRCLGRTEQHEPSYQPTMADYAADALALCDEQGFETFAAIGISFGGMVAQELAILAGDRLTRLVLACTSAGGQGGSSYPLHELYAAGKNMDAIADLWDVRVTADPAVQAQMSRILGPPVRPAEPPPGLLRQLEARRHHDTWDRLASISAATMVAYGLHDGVAPPVNNERLAAAIPHATSVGFDGGHLFMWQDRTAWPAIADFLDGEPG